jgi:hypothetical protein
MNRTRIVLITIVVAVLVGGIGYAGFTRMQRLDPKDLSLDLQVQPGEVTVLSLKLTNVGSDQLKLRFNTAQQYDFTVLKQEGTTDTWTKVWQWSAEMMFGQAETSLTLNPGETETFVEQFTPDGPGNYRVVATVTERGLAVETQTSFAITE